jgi:hypothetical protein
MYNRICLINFIFESLSLHNTANNPVNLFILRIIKSWPFSDLCFGYLDKTDTCAECCINFAAIRLPTKPLPPTIKNLRPERKDILDLVIILLIYYNVNRHQIIFTVFKYK